MSEKVETCFICAEPTGRAGAGEDSLYIGNIGPFDEKCWESIKMHLLSQLREGVEAEVKRCEAIEEARYSEEYAQSRLAIFNDGHIGGLTTALALIEKAGGE